jgi:hopene-associated glycosyltransferase HpnB
VLILAAIALGLWLALLLAPWQAWRCREHLEAAGEATAPGDDLTILIPARNEAAVIGETLLSVAANAPEATVIVIDDESDDDTAEKTRMTGVKNLHVLEGSPPPPGWAGKLWALEQGLHEARTPFILLLDADIALTPGLLTALRDKSAQGYALVSLLARPCFAGFWAYWLLPAFVYFFKLIYPFALANRARTPIAAAAGGIVLVERAALLKAGAFESWKDAIIDDCTLAARVKATGAGCWLGLTRDAHSLRRQGLASAFAMVSRSAYVQLRESVLLLLAATVLMTLVFACPLLALAFGHGVAQWLGALAWLLMAISYLPTLLYYRLNPLPSIFLPAVALIYLIMSWHSALRAWTGTRSVWKGRRYRRT